MIENIRLSLRGIMHHKMRSFLTMLGVIIGIASILAIVSIVEGTSRKLEKSLIGSGNNVVNIEVVNNNNPDMPASSDYYSADSVPSGFRPISDDALQSIKHLEHVKDASVFYSRAYGSDASVFYQNQSLGSPALYGVDANYFHTIDSALDSGRVFSAKEAKSSEKLCVLDTKAASYLFGSSKNAVNKIIEIGQEPFQIIGVINRTPDKKEDYESESDYYSATYTAGGSGVVYVPYGCWPLIGYFDEPQGIAVQVDETKNMQETGIQVSDLLNSYNTSTNAQYAAISSSQDADSLKQLTTALTALLVSIASLSLLVGGIGVMNIMLVSVSERTPEIGLKKALGARPKVIMNQFLTEAAVLTSVGGIIGIILGIGAGRLIAIFLTLDFAISIPWMLIAFGFSVGIGILFGFLPAHKAAKMNPIDALHRE